MYNARSEKKRNWESSKNSELPNTIQGHLNLLVSIPLDTNLLCFMESIFLNVHSFYSRIYSFILTALNICGSGFIHSRESTYYLGATLVTFQVQKMLVYSLRVGSIKNHKRHTSFRWHSCRRNIRGRYMIRVFSFWHLYLNESCCLTDSFVFVASKTHSLDVRQHITFIGDPD